MSGKIFFIRVCAVMTVLTIMFSLCACSKNEDNDESELSKTSSVSSESSDTKSIDKDLLGKWEGNYYGTEIYLEFKDDFTGKNYVSDFDYYTNSGYVYIKTGSEYNKFEYHVEDNVLKWTNPHTKEVLVYSKSKD